MDLELQGRSAVVTGGSRGIGRAVAAELAAAGVAVVIAARRAAPLQAAAAQLGGGARRRVVAVPADTTDDASVRALMQRAAAELGGVDILVNCAAPVAWLAPNPRLADLTGDQFEQALDVKVMGYLRCAREAAPLMRRRGWGRIINVAGLAARRAGSILGSIRNAGVVALTRNLAAELGAHGINVTCVHPGATRTELTPKLVARRAAAERRPAAEIEQELAADTAIGRMVTAHDVACLVCFLASPRSAALQGDVVTAAGGASGEIRY